MVGLVAVLFMYCCLFVYNVRIEVRHCCSGSGGGDGDTLLVDMPLLTTAFSLHPYQLNSLLYIIL